MRRLNLAVLLGVLSILTGQAQVRFNEMLINPPGTDNGQEFLELISATPNYSLDDIWFLSIEGDGTGAGVVDQALPLTGQVTGANRLLLWRDASTQLCPPPESETTVFVQDFNPDIENGSNTFALVIGFTGSVGMDLDPNDDGVLDVTPWTAVLDAVGWKDTATGDQVYGAAMGGFDFDYTNFTPGAYVLLCGTTRVAFTVTGTAPGPYRVNPSQINPPNALWDTFILTPGRSNPGIAGDFNGDGIVNDTDLTSLLQNYGQSGSCLLEDINLDGVVSDADLATQLLNYGLGC